MQNKWTTNTFKTMDYKVEKANGYEEVEVQRKTKQINDNLNREKTKKEG